MSEESRAMRAPNALRRPNKFVAYMRKYWFVYMLVLPGLVFMLVFDYGPMYGILLAFKDYPCPCVACGAARGRACLISGKCW